MSVRDSINAAWLAYRNADVKAAVESARSAVDQAPTNGEAWYVLGICLERSSALAQADRCFRIASHAKDNPQQPPYRVSWKRFLQIAERARENLPEKLRQAFSEVTVI